MRRMLSQATPADRPGDSSALEATTSWPCRSWCQDKRSNESRCAQTSLSMSLSHPRAHGSLWFRPGLPSTPPSPLNIAARFGSVYVRHCRPPSLASLYSVPWPSSPCLMHRRVSTFLLAYAQLATAFQVASQGLPSMNLHVGATHLRRGHKRVLPTVRPASATMYGPCRRLDRGI